MPHPPWDPWKRDVFPAEAIKRFQSGETTQDTPNSQLNGKALAAEAWKRELEHRGADDAKPHEAKAQVISSSEKQGLPQIVEPPPHQKKRLVPKPPSQPTSTQTPPVQTSSSWSQIVTSSPKAYSSQGKSSSSSSQKRP